MDNTLILKEQIGQLGLSLSEEQASRFVRFYTDLTEKNSVMNLTAITEWEDVVTKHFVDSLSLVKICPEAAERPLRVIDVGTGAGFPGIPLKIMFPKLEIMLADSVGKKVSFLREEIDRLGLTGISAVHGRAEDLARDAQYREQFDLCVSRAVANLSTLSEYCLPFVMQGGCFVAYKSGGCREECEAAGKAIRLLSGEVKRTEYFSLSPREQDEDAVSRTLIRVEKTGRCPERFPRKAGTPARNPLG